MDRCALPALDGARCDVESECCSAHVPPFTCTAVLCAHRSHQVDPHAALPASPDGEGGGRAGKGGPASGRVRAAGQPRCAGSGKSGRWGHARPGRGPAQLPLLAAGNGQLDWASSCVSTELCPVAAEFSLHFALLLQIVYPEECKDSRPECADWAASGADLSCFLP